MLHPKAVADAWYPFGTCIGPAAADLWGDLRRALPDGERRDDVFLMGDNHPDARRPGPRPSPIIACLGSYVGTFRAPFAVITPTDRVLALTYGEAHHFEGGKLRQSWLDWDIADLMCQAGMPLDTPPLSALGHWPPVIGQPALGLLAQMGRAPLGSVGTI